LNITYKKSTSPPFSPQVYNENSKVAATQLWTARSVFLKMYLDTSIFSPKGWCRREMEWKSKI